MTMGIAELDASYRRAFGENLMRLRLIAGFTSQPALARAMDNQPSAMTIGRWERGELLPDAHEVHRLCVVLGATADELVNPRELSEVERVLLRRGTAALRRASGPGSPGDGGSGS